MMKIMDHFNFRQNKDSLSPWGKGGVSEEGKYFPKYEIFLDGITNVNGTYF